MSAVLPEVPETEAIGEIAEIYADIRLCLKVDNVNLIYRYFATIDGALPWVWRLLRPYFISGQLEQSAENSLSLYRDDFQYAEDLSVAAMSIGDRQKISRTLDFYLRANPMNLFALQIVSNAVIQQGFNIANAQIRLLPLTEIHQAASARHFDSTAYELMFYVSQGMDSIRPTLLRQLAAWPDYVNSIADFVKTASCASQFERRTEAVYEHALGETRNLSLDEATQAIDAKAIIEIGHFCQYFPIILIRMTLIANRLRLQL